MINLLRRHREALAEVFLFCAFFGLGWGYWQLRQITTENSKARVALCTLRHDLDLRITASQDFLNKNPNGISGIPASVIRQSLANSRRTRLTLEALDCGGRK